MLAADPMRISRSWRVLLLLLGLGGCVVEGTLDAAGGGTLTLRYRLVSVANLEQMKARLAAPGITLTDASMTADKNATFALAVAQVRDLSAAPAFADLHVSLSDDVEGTRTFTATMGGTPASLPAPYVDYLGRELRVTLTFPGDVVRSNAGEVAGRTATWVRPLAEKGSSLPFTLTATFRSAPS